MLLLTEVQRRRGNLGLGGRKCSEGILSRLPFWRSRCSLSTRHTHGRRNLLLTRPLRIRRFQPETKPARSRYRVFPSLSLCLRVTVTTITLARWARDRGRGLPTRALLYPMICPL